MKLLGRWIATALAVAAAVHLVGGITVVSSGEPYVAICIFALVLGFVNSVIKPIFKVLSLPITFITLGIFYLFINTIMLYLASTLSLGIFGAGIEIASVGSAFLASIIISVVSAIVNAVLGNNE